MPGTDLATTEQLERLTPSDLDLIRAMYAPKATDAEMMLLAEISRQHQLSIFRDELAFIPKSVKQGDRWIEVHKPMITNQGRRVIAARSGQLRGIEGPFWTRPWDGPADTRPWDDVWEGPGYPRAARVIVHRQGHTPYRGTAMWDEAVQTYKDGRPLPTWEKMPAHMLGKVAESRALGRAFSELFVGLDYETVEATSTEIVGGGASTPDTNRRPELTGQGPRPTPTDTNPDEYLFPTKEQTDRVRQLKHTLGLDALGMRTVWVNLVSEAVGRHVTNMNDLGPDDVTALILALEEAAIKDTNTELEGEDGELPL